MADPCIICNNVNNNIQYNVKELQLGLNEEFIYQLCSNCGSTQLVNVPANLGKYYPNEGYYSFNMQLKTAKKPDLLRKIKTDYLLFGRHAFLGKLLSIGYKINELYEWVKYTGAKYEDAILDVGTGNGSLLTRLHQIGFKNLTGIDPFINESREFNHIRILKKNVFETEGLYDVIMMHHSLEHVLNPKETLKRVYDILKPGGKALIRVPIMGNYGWKTYGTYWCGLDAPRHIFIPSEKGIKQLVKEAGFIIDKFYYDSYAFIIICSEQYKKNIAQYASNSYLVNPSKSLFTKADIKRFNKIMIEENKNNNGDMAAIYLSKPL